MLKAVALACLTGFSAMTCAWSATPVEVGVNALQHDWEEIRYQTPHAEKLARWARLAARARSLSVRYPAQAEPLIWEGIVLSSWAVDEGGLGALKLVKQAKTLYENALAIDPNAMQGAAYNSLGVLYYKVPGWPIGFGDNNKAQALLERALSINPQGIDPNYFYGAYWVEVGRPQQAVVYLERALAAPARPGRHIADIGRKAEARALLKTIKASSSQP